MANLHWQATIQADAVKIGFPGQAAVHQWPGTEYAERGYLKSFAGDFSKRESADACFSEDGQWFFVTIQTPGITLAVTGPCKDGAL